MAQRIAPAHVAMCLTVFSAIISCSDVNAPNAKPNTLEAVTPLAVSAVVGTEVNPAPTVRLTNSAGQPVPAVEIKFIAVTGHNVVVDLRRVMSDANGSASMGRWLMPTTAQKYSILATADEIHVVVFTAVGTPDTPDLITRFRDIPQLELSESAVNLQVRVVDRFNNPVSGQDISFANETGGASVSSRVGRTDDAGVARVDWMLGPPGEYSITASVPKLPAVTFTVIAGERPDTTNGYFELAGIGFGSSSTKPFESWIALGKNGKFTMYADGVIGRGDFTIDGSTILFKYSDSFVSSMSEWLGYSIAELDETESGEVAHIQGDTIVFNRYFDNFFGDYLWSPWTYRQTGD